MTYTYASIVPLIGGMTIAQHQSSGKPPEYLMTYEGFQANESHLLNHYRDVYGIDLPYHYIDRGERPDKKVDVVNTTCPCAGLSQLSHGWGEDNPNNQWMRKTAHYVLGELKPQIFWGENAPGFATDMGKWIRDELYGIAREHGYTMSVYSTKSLLHGTPQIRKRSFYFFWREDGTTPLLNYFQRPWTKIEDLITGVKSNFQTEVINPKIPSQTDPYYRYILEELNGGIGHGEFVRDKMVFLNVRSNDVFSYIENVGLEPERLISFLRKIGNEKEALKCEEKIKKIGEGRNIMRRGTIIPNDYIGAFVGHYPTSLTHPHEDRYINYREAMSIMGLPENFELLDPKKSTNHICQNVPVPTARDMADEVGAILEGKRERISSTYTFQSNLDKSVRVETEKEPARSLEELFA